MILVQFSAYDQVAFEVFQNDATVPAVYAKLSAICSTFVILDTFMIDLEHPQPILTERIKRYITKEREQ